MYVSCVLLCRPWETNTKVTLVFLSHGKTRPLWTGSTFLFKYSETPSGLVSVKVINFTFLYWQASVSKETNTLLIVHRLRHFLTFSFLYFSWFWGQGLYVYSVCNCLFTDSRTTFLQVVLPCFCWQWGQHLYGFCVIINCVERGKYLISFQLSSVIPVDSRVSSSTDPIKFCFALVVECKDSTSFGIFCILLILRYLRVLVLRNCIFALYFTWIFLLFYFLEDRGQYFPRCIRTLIP